MRESYEVDGLGENGKLETGQLGVGHEARSRIEQDWDITSPL